MQTKHLLYILILLLLVVLVLIGYDIYRISTVDYSACVQDPIGYIQNATGAICSCFGGK
jgi:hypothetical protein